MARFGGPLTNPRCHGIVTRLVAALGLVLGCRAAPPPATAPAAPALAVAPAPRAPEVRTTIGFRSPKHLADHFRKHGAEFEGSTQAAYLRAAQELRDRPVGGDVLELVRPDRTVSRYDRKIGAFLAFDTDGTIRTFFRPADGEAYFQRQARRRQQ